MWRNTLICKEFRRSPCCGFTVGLLWLCRATPTTRPCTATVQQCCAISSSAPCSLALRLRYVLPLALSPHTAFSNLVHSNEWLLPMRMTDDR